MHGGLIHLQARKLKKLSDSVDPVRYVFDLTPVFPQLLQLSDLSLLPPSSPDPLAYIDTSRQEGPSCVLQPTTTRARDDDLISQHLHSWPLQSV